MPTDLSHPNEFDLRKTKILADIASAGPDASPKGSIDKQLLPLICRLNSHADVVTTSSCSGRTSVFLEGRKKTPCTREEGRNNNNNNNAVTQHIEGNKERLDSAPAAVSTVASADNENARPTAEQSVANAGAGGKGDGGKWLFVSHDPINVNEISAQGIAQLLLGRKSSEPSFFYKGNASTSTRFVHFKFEPMILHIQTRNLDTAQCIVSVALSCGFRESGIMNSTTGRNKFPIVAVRCAGLSMDAPIGVYEEGVGEVRRLVSDETLAIYVQFANLKFGENTLRVKNLTANLEAALFSDIQSTKPDNWEDKEVRKARKRAEGLKRQQELRETIPIRENSDGDSAMETST